MINAATRLKMPSPIQLLGVLFAVLAVGGPMHYIDSDGYLSGEGFRSPLYPLVVSICHFIGGYYGEWCVVLFQLAIGYYAVCWFSKQLCRAIQSPEYCVAIVMILCATPYFGITIRTGNAILTEGIAYPLFLIAMGFLLRAITNKNARDVVMHLLIVSLLVLARKQFLFLFIVDLILLCFLRLGGMEWGKIRNMAMLLLFLIPLTFFLEIANGYIRHGSAIPVSYTGKQLMVGALFVAKAGDAQTIEDEKKKKLFEMLYSEARKKSMTLDALDDVQRERTTNTFQHFFANYINLIVLTDEVFTNVYRADYKTEGERVILLDDVTKDIALKIIENNFIRYAGLYALNLSYGFGGHGIGDGYGLRGTYFFVLQIMILVAIIVTCRKRPRLTPIRNLLLFLTVVHWANVFEVALLEVALDRYTFYTSTLWLAAMAALIATVMESPHIAMNGKAEE